MKVLALVLTAASIAISVPALGQEPPPPEAAPPPAPPPPPPGYPPPAAYPPAGYPPPVPAAAPMEMNTSRFGGAGQITVAIDLPFGNSAPQFAILRESQTMGNPTTTVFAIGPSLDYFVIPNLSIGALLGVAYATASLNGTDASSTTLTVEPRVGYNIPASDLVSIWLRAGFAYLHSSSDSGGSTFSTSRSELILEAPVLFHVASHFFLGAGPVFQTMLSNNAESGGTSTPQAKATDIGIEAMVGGHFGGM